MWRAPGAAVKEGLDMLDAPVPIGGRYADYPENL